MSNHTVEGMKGKFKEAVGDISGDKGLQIEGKLDQAVADAKRQIDRLTDKMADKADKADKVDKADDSTR